MRNSTLYDNRARTARRSMAEIEQQECVISLADKWHNNAYIVAIFFELYLSCKTNNKII